MTATASGVRYQVSTIAHHTADASEWVAALPHGPITELTGIGPLILAIVQDAEAPMSAADVTADLRELVPDAPEDAEAVVAAFLQDLAQLGVLTIESGEG